MPPDCSDKRRVTRNQLWVIEEKCWNWLLFRDRFVAKKAKVRDTRWLSDRLEPRWWLKRLLESIPDRRRILPYVVWSLGTGRRQLHPSRNTPGAEIKVVAEPRDSPLSWQDRHADVDFVADYRDALERDDVDVIIGTLPHWLHHQAALDAAAAGKHIYMEKPTAVWASQAEEMLDAARENGVKLMTAHTQRYYPAVGR